MIAAIPKPVLGAPARRRHAEGHVVIHGPAQALIVVDGRYAILRRAGTRR